MSEKRLIVNWQAVVSNTGTGKFRVCLVCIFSTLIDENAPLHVGHIFNFPHNNFSLTFTRSVLLQLACEGLATLPQAVQLPCTALHAASWENKSLQQKRGDLVASLRILNEGVESVSALSQTPCATSVLQKLLQNIGNYLLILTHLHLSVRSLHGNPVHTQHLYGTVLQTYSRLSLANWSASWTT
uniref:Uncharacterized protein n=1 Tax=Neogobius melanostomus TaxID=47308 RepID=A0A8C6SWH3_9GOBI